MVKKKAKSSKPKAKKTKKKQSFYERNKDTISFILALSILAIIAFVFAMIQIYMSIDRTVVADVNGQSIYQHELTARHNNLPENMREAYSQEMVLDQMIQDLLLIQKINSLGIVATTEDVNNEIDEFRERNGMSEEMLTQAIRMQGMTRGEFRQQIINQVLLNKLLEKEVFVNLEVQDEELNDYYNKNIKSFERPELVLVNHILIAVNESEEFAQLKAFDIMRQAESGDDFCELVDLYSEDYAPCGEYEVSVYSGLPDEFVKAVLKIKDGQFTVVKTEFGYHVIRRTSTTPARLAGFEDVKEEIYNTILEERKQEAYSLFLYKIKDTAVIENYLLDKTIEEIKELPQYSELDYVAMCIGDKATLYGAKWDSVSKKQLELFGESVQYLNYVECSIDDCDDVSAYPAWVISGEEYLGLQSIERLTVLTSCLI